jgi:lysozyme
VGKITIGVGRNLTDQGITEAEAHILLSNDISRVMWEVGGKAPWYHDMTEARQLGFLNMAFNMGWPRLSGFQKMLSALQAGDYETAARECLDSKWSAQVKDRAVRIATAFKEG